MILIEIAMKFKYFVCSSKKQEVKAGAEDNEYSRSL